MRRVSRGTTWLVALLFLAGCTPPNLPAPLPPLSTESAPPPPTPSGTNSIGVDSGIRGFNPYVNAQYTPAAAAISALVLPSVFPAGATSDSAPTELVESAMVTETDPFTVTYTLNRAAAWSDGTPIAAEDFTYLWQQMIATPGVASPGGYQLIRSIESTDAGKTVQVVFAARFADWRTLFSPLLPARTLKDFPGGFTGALEGGIPVAGGVYKMDSYDPVIGQVTLVRNDKYWGAGTAASTAVFREGSAADLITALRRGDLQAAYLQPDGTAAAALGSVPGVRLVTAPLPVTVQLDFNLATGHPTAEQAVRTAVAAAVRSEQIVTTLAGGNPAGALGSTSQLMLAAQPGAPAAPPAGYVDDPGAVGPTLTAAGFQQRGIYFSQDDAVLALVLGYPIGDDRAAQTARLLQRQLGSAGFLLNLVQLAAADAQAALVGDSVPDMVLRSVPRGASDLAEAVQATNCAGPLQAAAETTTGTTSATTTTTTAGTGDAVVPPVCDAETESLVSDLLDGADLLPELDAQLWQSMSALPLAEPTATLALGPTLADAAVPTEPAELLWGGVLQSVAEWPAPG